MKEATVRANKNRTVTMLAPRVMQITAVEQKAYGSLAHYLLNMIPEASIETIPNCSYCTPDRLDGRQLYIPGFPQKLISVSGSYADRSKFDFCRVCQEDYLSLEMKDVLKVTIKGLYAVNGLNISVSIIMRPGVLEAKDYFDNITADMVGYYKARVFYQSKFGSIDDSYDPRQNTVHWQPDIITNDKGEATLTYFNTDRKDKLRLIVQGVTVSGEPVAAMVETDK